MSPADRPLVTFALFAYNQEQYVREAIEGAFAQTYEPLEIILSDDCSSDRTFEIMQEMAAAYEGPHRVVARRNPLNYGTALHVQAVAEQSTGELMVVAAGDDVSAPHRTATIVEAWLDNGMISPIVHSGALIKSDSATEAPTVAAMRSSPGETVDLGWFLRRNCNPALAPTAAYARRLFTDFPPLIGGSIIEDGPLLIRGLLCGVLLGISEPLVVIRRPAVSSSRGYSVRDIPRWNSFIRSKMVSQFTKLQDIETAKSADRRQTEELTARTTRELRRLGQCVMPDSAAESWLGRVGAMARIFLFYPNNYSVKAKLGIALAFAFRPGR